MHTRKRFPACKTRGAPFLCYKIPQPFCHLFIRQHPLHYKMSTWSYFQLEFNPGAALDFWTITLWRENIFCKIPRLFAIYTSVKRAGSRQKLRPSLGHSLIHRLFNNCSFPPFPPRETFRQKKRCPVRRTSCQNFSLKQRSFHFSAFFLFEELCVLCPKERL